ncbi:MAG: ribosome-associated heat shock protein Hsp15 [Oleispira sp.]|jgi:ribosome-associated heat shock protein Hsp15|nr:ribosome-associated heat shock protein Hsp15 [Oleispira sp.]
MSKQSVNENKKIRLDKWLWAARFYKTRSIAKAAIEGGKVHYDGQRCKVSKTIEVGAKLTIRQSLDEKIVEIKALSDQRRGAPEAQALYEETAASIKARMDNTERRRIMKDASATPERRPNKKQRRQIHQFKHQSEI